MSLDRSCKKQACSVQYIQGETEIPKYNNCQQHMVVTWNLALDPVLLFCNFSACPQHVRQRLKLIFEWAVCHRNVLERSAAITARNEKANQGFMCAQRYETKKQKKGTCIQQCTHGQRNSGHFVTHPKQLKLILYIKPHSVRMSDADGRASIVLEAIIAIAHFPDITGGISTNVLSCPQSSVISGWSHKRQGRGE